MYLARRTIVLLSFSLFFCTDLQACPRYKDKVFFDQKVLADKTGDYEKFWSEIDLSNGKCLMQKYAEKGALIILGRVRIDKCEGVRFLRMSMLENLRINKGTIMFDPSERWALQILSILYGDSYFDISAIEGDAYSRLKVAERMLERLDGNLGLVLQHEANAYVRTILDYLNTAKKNHELHDEVIDLLGRLKLKYDEASDAPHVNTEPRKVICEAVSN